MADFVTSLIDDLGNVTLVLTRATKGAYNPAAGTYATGTTTTQTIKVAPVDVKFTAFSGDSLQMGDMFVLIPPESVTGIPQAGDSAAIYGANYKIVEVKRENFRGADKLYSCQLRRSQ